MTTEVTRLETDHWLDDAQTLTTASNAEVAIQRSDQDSAGALGPRPHGHVVGHRVGDPAPASRDGSPRGHVVGHGSVRRRDGALPSGVR